MRKYVDIVVDALILKTIYWINIFLYLMICAYVGSWMNVLMHVAYLMFVAPLMDCIIHIPNNWIKGCNISDHG